MKIIFVLDDQEVVAANPEQLTLIQVKEGVTAVAIQTGQNEEGNLTYLPMITFPVNLAEVVIPEPVSPKKTRKAKHESKP